MKKNGFLEGAFIATGSVILCKVLGLLYVIPFYAIIGTQGGALYSYAYSIYSIFLSLATVGIPTAMSKIISEYNAMDYHVVKMKAYRLGSKLIVWLGIISFIILFIFAPQISYLIKGNSTGGNSIDSVVLVIRTVSTALLIVPILSVKRGFLQGHKYIQVPQFSTVIEQLVRVIVVVVGSYLVFKVLELPLDQAIAVAVFGATLGALISYFYVDYKIRKHKDYFNLNASEKEEEKSYTTKIILKKIVFYAFPFVLIDLAKSSYGVVDLFTVVKTLTNIGYSVVDAENVVGVISTWASKLNMIIVSFSIGLTASLIPNIMPSFIKKDFKDVSHKINQALQVLIILTIPMTIGLCFLSYPVWNAFYGYNEIGMNLLKVYVILAFTLSFQSLLIDSSQIMNNTKLSFGSLLIGIIIKLILNIPMMYLCKYIGIEGYYGSTIASIISQSVTIIFLLYQLKKQYKLDYNVTRNTLWKVMIASIAMICSLFIINIFLPLNFESRKMSILVCIIYSIIGAFVYFTAVLKLKIIPSLTSYSDVKKLIMKKIGKKKK